jgi:Ni/Fe-hydrogenase subunit HybB-like protein
MKKVIPFALDFVSYAVKGGSMYYAWLLFLSFFVLVGVYTSYEQFTKGLIVIGATDQVQWELYMSNFIFTAHIAAAAVLVVIPAYIYKRKDMKDLAVLGEIIALSFVSIGIFFILYHVGRPERMWHMMPVIGLINFPHSMLVFDVIVLNVYLIVNSVAVAYLLFKKYIGQPINKKFYTPLIYLAVAWGPLIHICTAFVLSSNPRVHSWATAVLPFAFLSMAGASGPALIIIIFLIIRKYTRLQIDDAVFDLFSQIMAWSLGILLLVLASEYFTELYSGTHHAASLKFNMFGHHGITEFVPWFWVTMGLIVGSFVLLLFPKIRKSYNRYLPAVSAVVFLSVLVEKPIILVFPAFVPTPLGEYVEYHPTLIEYFNMLFVWACGFMGITLLMKGALGILTGEVRHPDAVDLTGGVR